MYTSPNGLTNALAILDVAEYAAEPEPRQDRLLRSAHRTVDDVAPPAPPDGRTEAYKEAARDAEIAVLEYLLTTQGGILKSAALSGVDSQTFASFDVVARLVRGAMGSYAAPGEEASPGSSNATVFNVSPYPLWSSGSSGGNPYGV